MAGHRVAFVKSEPQSLGQKIRRQRRALFLTQEDLAARLGVKQSNVSRWESDERTPALRHRAALAEALHIAPHILYEGIEDGEVAA